MVSVVKLLPAIIDLLLGVRKFWVNSIRFIFIQGMGLFALWVAVSDFWYDPACLSVRIVTLSLDVKLRKPLEDVTYIIWA